MRLPDSEKRLISKSLQILEDCNSSSAARASNCQTLRGWKLTGSDDGNPAIYNRLEPHIQRVAGYLFSSAELRFLMEFENKYPQKTYLQAAVAAKYLTKSIERQDIDLRFAAGVEEALTFGCSILKLMYGNQGLTSRIISPWNFSVYREGNTLLSEQEAVAETAYITKEDFWRRISHLPDAAALYKRAISHAKKNNVGEPDNSYFHSVLLAGSSPIQPGNDDISTGGMVSVNSNFAGQQMSAETQAELITFYELTVLDDNRGDYTTIQICAPDILITPRMKRTNLFLPQELPYVKIQPNSVEGYFWGRSELAPLLKLQNLLAERMDDMKQIMGLQYDRLLAFVGFSGMDDEMYDRFKQSGFIAQEQPGAKVEDLTPKLPEAAFAEIKEILSFMDDVSGFQNILSGQGEPGVRSGNHAQTLMKTASPRMRQKAMQVERQIAEVGDKSFKLLKVKEARAHWIGDKIEDQDDAFLLSAIPEDARVVVDSHSASPVYEEDHKEMAFALLKAGIVDGESVLDLVPVPHRDLLKERYAKIKEEKAAMIAKYPQLAFKGGKK